MRKSQSLTEKELLDERSKMIAELLLNVLDDRRPRGLNTPKFSIFDLIDIPMQEKKKTPAHTK